MHQNPGGLLICLELFLMVWIFLVQGHILNVRFDGAKGCGSKPQDKLERSCQRLWKPFGGVADHKTGSWIFTSPCKWNIASECCFAIKMAHRSWTTWYCTSCQGRASCCCIGSIEPVCAIEGSLEEESVGWWPHCRKTHYYKHIAENTCLIWNCYLSMISAMKRCCENHFPNPSPRWPVQSEYKNGEPINFCSFAPFETHIIWHPLQAEVEMRQPWLWRLCIRKQGWKNEKMGESTWLLIAPTTILITLSVWNFLVVGVPNDDDLCKEISSSAILHFFEKLKIRGEEI